MPTFIFPEHRPNLSPLYRQARQGPQSRLLLFILYVLLAVAVGGSATASETTSGSITQQAISHTLAEFKGTDEELNKTRYQVVINHEEQYSIWLADRDPPKGWKGVGKTGSKKECMNYIEEVWTDMRPLSLEKQLQELEWREREKGRRK